MGFDNVENLWYNNATAHLIEICITRLSNSAVNLGWRHSITVRRCDALTHLPSPLLPPLQAPLNYHDTPTTRPPASSPREMPGVTLQPTAINTRS